MSYENMVREDMCCDFPGCEKSLEQAKDEEVAIKDGDKILAFCKTHCEVLKEHGVKLQKLADIHAEIKLRKEASEEVMRAVETVARETAFINRFLKK